MNKNMFFMVSTLILLHLNLYQPSLFMSNSTKIFLIELVHISFLLNYSHNSLSFKEEVDLIYLVTFYTLFLNITH